MASMQKYSNMGDIQRIIGHDNRTNKTYSNQEINHEKTKDNIIFKNTSMQKFRAKLKDYYIYGNKPDTVKLCSVVVTEPKDFDLNYTNAERKEIWQAINCFLEKQYGKDNTITSTVHLDETTPHLHFTFIPALKEQKSKRNQEVVNKLCCKKIWTKEHFNNFHKELRDYLNNYFDDEPDTINRVAKDFFGAKKGVGDLFYTGITKAQGGNRTIQELKEISALNEQITALKEQLAEYTPKEQKIENTANFERTENIEPKEQETELQQDYFTHDEEEEYTF